MQRVLAGIFLLLTLVPSVCFADTKGEVESIGFGWMYRPNCQIPMLVRVQADKSGTYQIRVVQEDMDRDQEIFTQTVSLTGSEEGKTGDQRFWLYFIPQPTDGGLPDTSRGGSLRDLQQQLKVFLCDEKGKQIAQLPITQTILNLDAVQGGPFSAVRGTRLVLAVSDTAAQPVWRDYQQAIGLLEDVVFVSVRAVDLPEDVRGYESVDAVVWLNAAAPDPAKATDEKRYHALRQYVRAGGHLVICQPPQREATIQFDDLLPVTVSQIAPKPDLEPLKTLATAALQKAKERATPSLRTREEDLQDIERGPNINDWDRPKGPFMFARAELKPGAIAQDMINWDAEGKDRTPWLARIGYGTGSVTWVAMDLSDPAITARAKAGWPFVWDHVLDYRNDLLIVDSRTTDDQKKPYAPGPNIDIGHALLGGMELTSKSRALVSIAVVFFIAYWVVAGPGVYFYLLTRQRPQLSWFFFALSALAATVLTVLVVRLVVRGSPELSHVTMVRADDKTPPVSMSRFGLYIPRDGAQEIKLPDTLPKEVSYITAYPEHPAHAQGDIEFPAQIPYIVPIRDASSDDAVAISVPYRSTLKKFQARRVGPAGGLIQGSPKIRPTGAGFDLAGVLTNGTGKKLVNVYLIYYDSSRQDDVILYAPTWEKGQSIDLMEFDPKVVKWIRWNSRDAGSKNGIPEDHVRLWGVMGKPGVGAAGWAWSQFWFGALRSNGLGAPTHDDMGDSVPKTFPMMSLFDRLPPMRNTVEGNDRVEVLRRGGRYLDVSSAVAAGRLVILAQSDGDVELPFPLEVEDEKIAGKGKVFYQIVLPLEHPAGTEVASTQPVDAPPDVAEHKSTAPEFDPATYTGSMNSLTPEQRNQVMQARRQRFMNQRGRQRPGQTPPPQSVPPGPRSSVDDAMDCLSPTAIACGTPEAALCPL